MRPIRPLPSSTTSTCRPGRCRARGRNRHDGSCTTGRERTGILRHRTVRRSSPPAPGCAAPYPIFPLMLYEKARSPTPIWFAEKPGTTRIVDGVQQILHKAAYGGRDLPDRLARAAQHHGSGTVLISRMANYFSSHWCRCCRMPRRPRCPSARGLPDSASSSAAAGANLSPSPGRRPA